MNAKYLVANIAGNRIIVCAVVSYWELKEGVKQMSLTAGEKNFDVNAFCKEGSAGESATLSNGTTIQFLYLGENL